MKNQEIITNFIKGATSGHTPVRNITNGYHTFKGTTLSIDGDNLINYTTIIATRDGNTIKLNITKYSSTTSKIQSLIKRECINNSVNLIEYEG